MDYNYFIFIAILMFTTTSIRSFRSKSWADKPVWIKSVDIYNESAINVRWQYSTLGTEPSTVNLSVIVYRLNTTDAAQTSFVIDGQQRFTYTSAMIVKNDFFKSNAYYGIALKYNATYYVGTNDSTWLSLTRWDRLFNMANTSIPTEEIKTDSTANSIVVSFLWPIEIPVFKLEMNAELNDMNTSLPIEISSNETYLIYKYKFQNLLPETEYRVSTTFKKKYLSNTDVGESTVGTSRTIRTLSNSALSVLMKFFSQLPDYLLGYV